MCVRHHLRPESSLSCEVDLFPSDEQNGFDPKVLQTFKCHPRGLVPPDTLPGNTSLAEESKQIRFQLLHPLTPSANQLGFACSL